MIFPSINLIGAAVGAIAAMVVGMIWHGPLFGQRWMKLMGFTKATMKKMKMSPQKAMALALVMQLITAGMLAVVMKFAGITDMAGGAMLGLLIGVGLMLPREMDGYRWENKPFELFILGGLYRIIVFIVMGAIIGFF